MYRNNRKEYRKIIRTIVEATVLNSTRDLTMEFWTRDVTTTGIGLRWAKWWYCRKCPYTIEWEYNNIRCRLKKCIYDEELFYYLQPQRNIQIVGYLTNDLRLNQIDGKIIWVEFSSEKNYIDVGVKFINPIKE